MVPCRRSGVTRSWQWQALSWFGSNGDVKSQPAVLPTGF